jgi:hypothetical protein
VAAIDEALELAARLRVTGTPLAGFIANRVLDLPAAAEPGELRARLGVLPGVDPFRLEHEVALIAELGSYLRRIAQAQHQELARLCARSPGLAITRVPLLAHDVSSLQSLRAVADCLAGSVERPCTGPVGAES